MMESLPPDPYRALGLSRDATAATIKSAYRKAALKCHPDKAPGKGDEFHRIQQAYELIGDEEKRQKYDNQVRLMELKKDVYGRRVGPCMPSAPPIVEMRTASYDVRNSPSPTAGFASRSQGFARDFPDPRTSKSPYEEDDRDSYFDARGSRRLDGSVRRPPPRPTRSDEVPASLRPEKPSVKDRTAQQKQRDRDVMRERQRKHAFAEQQSSDSDEDTILEASRRELRQREDERERARYADTRKRDIRREEEGMFEDRRARKISDQESFHQQYTNRTRAEEGFVPPTPSRVPYEPPVVEVRKSSREPERPAMPRRNSTKPKEKIVNPEPPRLSRKESRRGSGDRRSLDIVEPPPLSRTTSSRRPPTWTASHSSPSSMKIPPPEPRRSRTVEADFDPRGPPAALRRSETMPVQSSSSRPKVRRSDATPTAPSNLRYETADSGYSTSSPSETAPAPPPSSFKKYRYPESSPRPEYDESAEIHSGYPSIFREPSRTRRSPSPRERERERVSARPAPPTSRSASYAADHLTQAAAAPPVRRPSMSRSDSMRSRRPSTSSGTIPSLSRGASMPLGTPTPSVLRTGGFSSKEKDGSPFFADYMTSSPVDIRPLQHQQPLSGQENVRRAFDGKSMRNGRTNAPEDIRYAGYGVGGPEGRRRYVAKDIDDKYEEDMRRPPRERDYELRERGERERLDAASRWRPPPRRAGTAS